MPVEYCSLGSAQSVVNHKVVDVTLGRTDTSLRRHLQGLEDRSNVQVVVMDLSETYRAISRRYFPSATIVADRFHVIRLINQHFLKIWQEVNPEGRKNRGLLLFANGVEPALLL